MFNELVCDEATCDHREEIEALTEDLIGKECPKCGADLLTREDYEVGKRMQAAIDVLRDLGIAKGATEGGGDVLMSVNPHAGELNISLKPTK